jgi:cytochrome c oxidase assembly protein subunit 15
MEKDQVVRSSRPVAIWLLIGVFMIMIQVLLGGITRLTGSGLSITEWAPIMGTVPPLNETEWNQAFDQYKQIAQYKYLNTHFTLEDFKFIYFWEWFHRLWARLIGVVFLIPFIIFLVQKRFKQEMVRPLIVLFLLGALQGLVGWIMVKSGLNDSELLYVSHYKLAIHFILALGLLVYTLWFALKLLVPASQLSPKPRLNRLLNWILGLLVLQLIYGAFMAGLKAATTAPTWPDINGGFWPQPLSSFAGRSYGALQTIVDHPLMIHFIHRNLAYIITALVLIWTLRAWKEQGSSLFRRLRSWPLILVLLQVMLGIFTVLYSPKPDALLWLGVAHQAVAMLLLLALVAGKYVVRKF